MARPPTKELADLAKECMGRAAKVDQPATVAEDARAALQCLVDDRRVRMMTLRDDRGALIGTHRDAIRAIKRALAVDVQVPANRKGGVPRALGLVGRVSKTTAVQHLAIMMMMSRLLNDGFSKRASAEGVAVGFDAVGIELTAENVEKVHERYWKPVVKPPTRR